MTPIINWIPLFMLQLKGIAMLCGTLSDVLHEMLSGAITDTEVRNQKNRVHVTGREKKYMANVTCWDFERYKSMCLHDYKECWCYWTF